MSEAFRQQLAQLVSGLKQRVLWETEFYSPGYPQPDAVAMTQFEHELTRLSQARSVASPIMADATVGNGSSAGAEAVPKVQSSSYAASTEAKTGRKPVASPVSVQAESSADQVTPSKKVVAVRENASSKQAALRDLAQRLATCHNCGLGNSRTNVVFSDGSINARLAFVGDFPDETEDIIGLPFTSDRGILLDKIIRAMKMQRESIYLCNAVKCHPPGGQSPTTEQMDACGEFLEQQLDWVNPEVVVVMGEAVTRRFLNSDAPFDQIQGVPQMVAARQVVPVYDLNAMIANPALKKPVWQALQEVMKMLESGVED